MVIKVIETVDNPKTEMAAELSTDAYLQLLAENDQLRKQLTGAIADRDALAETGNEMRQLLQWMTREAATARYSTLRNDKDNALINIQHKGDYFLARNR
jgi:hypothetical protein